MDSPQGGFLGCHKQVSGIYLIGVEPGYHNTTHRIHLFDAVYFISPKNDAQKIVGIGQVDVYRITFHAEVAAVQVYVITDIKAVYKSSEKYIATVILSLLHFDYIIIEVCRISHTVNTWYGRDYHHVFAPGKQGGSGGKPEFVDFVIDSKIFFYVSVRGRKIGFGLVIIIVGHIIFYRIVRKESFELAVQLCCQRLVMAQYERRFVDVGYDVGNGKRFSGTCYTK